MRNLFFVICIIVLGGGSTFGQNTIDTLGGSVSFKTSQNIYVKFQSTAGIAVGDTLFINSQGGLLPVLVVKNISSTSCVGTLFTELPIETGARIVARVKSVPKADLPKIPPQTTVQDETEADTSSNKEAEKKKIVEKSEVKGRISASSYINFSDQSQNDQQRMRYTFTLNARRIGNTGLSAESYLSFRHTINEWQDVKDNFKKAFKVYSLALEYGLNNGTRFWLGRKINFNISNVGAIDGLQVEKKWNKTLVGAFAGTRPDLTDYGFNANLLQFGAYAGNTIEGKNGMIMNTLAIAEQRSHGLTDRRFAYFQHINSAIKHLSIFTSFEFDLFKLQNDKPKSTFDVSSIYFSVRYRASDKFSVFGSYDARKNIIYYETYKNFIDQLLEDETRQGFRFSFNYHPFKKITVGSSAGYRFQKGNPSPSENLYSYLTVSRVPGIDVAATASLTLIQSAYLNGLIYGVRLSRDLVKGKLYGEAEYRIVEYKYRNVEFPLKQSIVGANLSWRFSKKLSFSVNYEGEIKSKQLSNRIYTNLIRRF